MSIRLLGPLALTTTAGRPVEVAGAKRQAVLALLALELDRCVPVQRFFAMLWGTTPPARAKAAVQGHVAAIRKALADTPFTLRTQDPGYLLTGPAEQIDANQFTRLADSAAGLADDNAIEVLRAALALWTGPPLAELPDTALCRELAGKLTDDRRAVVDTLARRLLRRGTGADAIPALRELVDADGLREPTVALLVRCLHQAGRTGEALELYHRTSTRLVDELGVSPGVALTAAFAELQDTARPSARSDAGYQRPRRPVGFVGRQQELAALDRERRAGRTGTGLTVVIGPAGIGKTATVLSWAYAVAGSFPDGWLFADLRGFDPAGPADPGEVQVRFLRALGVPDTGIPDYPAARAALYADQTRQHELLIVLDNAAGAAHVRPLLPAGSACTTVITSRDTMTDLVVTEGATVLPLAALPDADACTLLDRLLTEDRVHPQQDSADRLVALCQGLPLALRIATARLAARPEWTIAELVAELADERTRLLALDMPGAASVHAALSLTYRHLPPDAARLLPLLAVHPGADVGPFAAAALLERPVEVARSALDALSSVHLLTENAPGRFGRHDFIRLFARELLGHEYAGAEPGATARLQDYFLAVTQLAVRSVRPGWELGQVPEFAPAALPALPDERAALAWFRLAEPTIRSLVAAGEPRIWGLAWLSNPLYIGAGQLADRLSCMRSGLRAALAGADRAAVVAMRTLVASALIDLQRYDEARTLAAEAVAGSTPADGYLHADALTALAAATAMLGDHDEACRLIIEAVDLIRATGMTRRAATTLSYTAGILGHSGRVREALDYTREVRALLADAPGATAYLIAMVNEAQALAELGEPAEAERVYRECLDQCRSAGSLYMTAAVEQHLAELLIRVGRRGDAVTHLRQAIELYTLRGDTALVDQLSELTEELQSTVDSS